ncbi:hypothetical protein BMF94_3347 [Rhodotorula taiwanensis]|uniref:F-box domain-containing protein n=1 Tax=Rhodotorula taiwanensis TaxID=741276 RepID=A0A2S5BAK5_9BASI|nr:hypothetical protein BMF94_3347 [Rhodotorula taiwanensis]
MRDRLPTELVSLIITAAFQPTAWRRKALLDKLGLVCKSWRRFALVLAQETLEIDRASAVEVVCKWPAARRELIKTVLVGKEMHSREEHDDGFSTVVLDRLLFALPILEHAYMQNLDYTQAGIAVRVAPGCQAQKLRSLSICDAEIKILPAVDSAPLAVRRLRVQVNTTQNLDNLERLLRATSFPHLELLRLSSDTCLLALIVWQPDHRMFKTTTPTLFSFKHGIGEWPLTADPIVKYVQASLNDAGATSRGRYADGASNVKIVHDCPPLYDFVQPAFLDFLAQASGLSPR